MRCAGGEPGRQGARSWRRYVVCLAVAVCVAALASVPAVAEPVAWHRHNRRRLVPVPSNASTVTPAGPLLSAPCNSSREIPLYSTGAAAASAQGRGACFFATPETPHGDVVGKPFSVACVDADGTPRWDVDGEAQLNGWVDGERDLVASVQQQRSNRTGLLSSYTVTGRDLLTGTELWTLDGGALPPLNFICGSPLPCRGSVPLCRSLGLAYLLPGCCSFDLCGALLLGFDNGTQAVVPAPNTSSLVTEPFASAFVGTGLALATPQASAYALFVVDVVNGATLHTFQYQVGQNGLQNVPAMVGVDTPDAPSGVVVAGWLGSSWQVLLLSATMELVANELLPPQPHCNTQEEYCAVQAASFVPHTSTAVTVLCDGTQPRGERCTLFAVALGHAPDGSPSFTTRYAAELAGETYYFRVFDTWAAMLYEWSQEPTLYAYDLTDGHAAWTAPLPYAASGAPPTVPFVSVIPAPSSQVPGLWLLTQWGSYLSLKGNGPLALSMLAACPKNPHEWEKVAVGIVVGLRTALTIVQLGVTWKQGKNPTLTRVQAAFDVLVTPFLLAVAIVAQVVLLSKISSFTAALDNPQLLPQQFASATGRTMFNVSSEMCFCSDPSGSPSGGAWCNAALCTGTTTQTCADAAAGTGSCGASLYVYSCHCSYPSHVVPKPCGVHESFSQPPQVQASVQAAITTCSGSFSTVFNIALALLVFHAAGSAFKVGSRVQRARMDPRCLSLRWVVFRAALVVVSVALVISLAASLSTSGCHATGGFTAAPPPGCLWRNPHDLRSQEEAVIAAVQAALFVQTAKPIHWVLMLVSDKLDWSEVHTWTKQAWAVGSALWGVAKAARRPRQSSSGSYGALH